MNPARNHFAFERFYVLHSFLVVAMSCMFWSAINWNCSACADLFFINDQTVEGHVAQLKSQIIPRDSQGYVEPSAQELADFRNLAQGLWNAGSTSDLNNLVPLAGSLDYDVFSLNDAGSTYFGLQESNSGTARKGWGSFFVKQNASRNALVQVTHPLADINTPSIGAQAFVGSDAKGLLIAGAHRNANGQGTADVAHLAESVFHEVHQSFVANTTDPSVWQIHGFNLDLHPEFPAGTDAVISSGTGSVTELVLGLDQTIDQLPGDWTSYAHNTLDVNDLLNIATNETFAGSVFSSLAATTNIQQQHTTSVGGQFVHIELEQSFRIDGGDFSRQLIGQTIANAISSSVTAVPEPNPVAILALLAGWIAVTRRKS